MDQKRTLLPVLKCVLGDPIMGAGCSILAGAARRNGLAIRNVYGDTRDFYSGRP